MSSDRPWTIGVISDPTTACPDATATERGLIADASLLEAQSGLATAAMIVASEDGGDLAARLDRLPPEVGAIFLTRTERGRAHEAQRLLNNRGARTIITEDDAIAITLTAAVVVYLARLRCPHPSAQVAIVGAASVPILCPLLLAAGIFHITMWNPWDDRYAPLSAVTRDADVVVNLLGDDPAVARIAHDRPRGSVIGIGDGQQHLLPLPGLFRAIADSPGLVDIQAYHACARGLVNATPPGQPLPPDPNDPFVAEQVAAAAARAVNPAFPC